MKRRYQQIMTCIIDNGAKTFKSSFKTLESAIEDSNKYIYHLESWMTREIAMVDILDKETNEIVWTYRA